MMGKAHYTGTTLNTVAPLLSCVNSTNVLNLLILIKKGYNDPFGDVYREIDSR